MSTILKFSDAFTLGIHAAVLLAANPEDPLPVEKIAKTIKVSANHLSKVMQRLAKAGMVRSIRGPKGGFVLERKPDDIRLMEIYEAIEGEYPEGRCLFRHPVCGGKKCAFGGWVQNLNDEVKNFFKNRKLIDMVQEGDSMSRK